MMASAPSKIALATSETSARVGRRCVTIDSSICVATITGTFHARACRMISFWMCGTSSIGTSSPRSPRATITASTLARMPGRFFIASCRSSFATIGTSVPRSSNDLFTSMMSDADRTNETAMKSTPCSMPNLRSSRSLSVRHEIGSGTCGSDTPLWSLMRPPWTTRQRTSSGEASSTRSWIMPSSIRIWSPART